VMFGYGLIYYSIGGFMLRTPGASVVQIVAAAAMYAIPIGVLLAPQTRAMFRSATAAPDTGRSPAGPVR
jgi:hypothetical protein